MKQEIIPIEIIESKIFSIRGNKVMLDKDLAEIYNVETKVLKQAVKRNIDIFPAHFMFELTQEEYKSLRSQIVTSNKGRGGTRYLPMVFTEHGVLQLASVLRSERAKQMSIKIIEVFVQIRKQILNHNEILKKLGELERSDKKQGQQIEVIFKYIQQLESEKQQTKTQKERVKIGFKQK